MGFDFNRFVDLSKREAKHLICSICLNIYHNAINSECGHTFCKECVQKWIQDNHSVCPECRKEFSRKRSNEVLNNDILILISNHIFSRNLKLNSIINELNIKCDYDFNGCKTSVELGLLSSHMKECPHRYCEKCGFTAGRPTEHNCVELMKRDRNHFKHKFNETKEQKSKLEEEVQRMRVDLNRWKSMYEKSEQMNKELSESVSKLKELMERYETDWKLKFNKSKEIETKLRQEVDSKKDFFFDLHQKLEDREHNTEYVLFGTHSILYCSIVLRLNRMYFKSPVRSQFFLPITHIEELMFCLDPILPVIVLKANSFSGNIIGNKFQLNSSSSAGYYDVESNDPSHRYTIIRFSRASEEFLALILYLFGCKPKTLSIIDSNKTRQMLEMALKHSH